MNIKSIIPITIASLNLACGTVGVVATFFGRIDVAFLIGLTGTFDPLPNSACRVSKVPVPNDPETMRYE